MTFENDPAGNLIINFADTNNGVTITGYSADIFELVFTDKSISDISDIISAENDADNVTSTEATTTEAVTTGTTTTEMTTTEATATEVTAPRSDVESLSESETTNKAEGQNSTESSSAVE